MTTAFSIESGYFIFTMMPSLTCELNCPHCYLSLEQRRSKDRLSLDDLSTACQKVADYYRARGLAHKTLVFYWYGGEPTMLGQDYFLDALVRIREIFPREDGYTVKHVVLSALVGVDPSWFDIFNVYTGRHLQTSFDGAMRGKGYLRQWEKQVRAAQKAGLTVSTISVVNQELLAVGPEKVLDYLADLGIQETSWLPFMWNTQNDGGAYSRFAPLMSAYEAFMIDLTTHWYARKRAGLAAPEIGQQRFILAQAARPGHANIAGQTLFLLPNGDFVLPDYRHGYQEFMQPFGNILTDSFSEVLSSPARRAYLRKQVLRNNNPDCLRCEHADKCIMEFWKENREGDACFGAKGYVEWLLASESRQPFPHQQALLS